MNGLELSRAYFETCALPMLRARFPQLLPQLAAPLREAGVELVYGYSQSVTFTTDLLHQKFLAEALVNGLDGGDAGSGNRVASGEETKSSEGRRRICRDGLVGEEAAKVVEHRVHAFVAARRILRSCLGADGGKVGVDLIAVTRDA